MPSKTVKVNTTLRRRHNPYGMVDSIKGLTLPPGTPCPPCQTGVPPPCLLISTNVTHSKLVIKPISMSMSISMSMVHNAILFNLGLLSLNISNTTLLLPSPLCTKSLLPFLTLPGYPVYLEQHSPLPGNGVLVCHHSQPHACILLH